MGPAIRRHSAIHHCLVIRRSLAMSPYTAIRFPNTAIRPDTAILCLMVRFHPAMHSKLRLKRMRPEFGKTGMEALAASCDKTNHGWSFPDASTFKSS